MPTITTQPTQISDGAVPVLLLENAGPEAVHVYGLSNKRVPYGASVRFRTGGEAVYAYTPSGTANLVVNPIAGGGGVDTSQLATREFTNVDPVTGRAALGLGDASTRDIGTTAGMVAAGDDSRIVGAAQRAQNLADLDSPATARTNLGLSDAATRSVGTTAGTVAAGDDSRVTGAAQKAANLSDLANTATARSNLGAEAAGAAAAVAASVAAALEDKANLVGGKVPTDELPPLTINEWHPVESQAEMLALSAAQGDVAVRVDLDPAEFYLLAETPAATLENWTPLGLGGGVTSVAGRTGVVALAIADVAGLTVALAARAAADLSNVDPATGRAALEINDSAQLPVGTTAGTVAAGNDARIVGAAQKSANLSDLGNTATARTNLGAEAAGAAAAVAATLGTSATRNVGTVTGTVAAGDDARITGAAQKSANLADLGNAGTSRTNLGLGDSATRNVGTASGTVAAGDDSRISGAAQKSANLADLGSAALARGSLGLGDSATRSIGTTAGTVAAGDDSRLSNPRTPTAHAASHASGGTDPVTLAQAQVTGLAAALSARPALVDGKIPTEYLPSVVVGETFAAANQAAMLALTAEHGDVAVREDLGKRFVLVGDPTVLGDWIELDDSGAVESVAGKTGVVSLDVGDVGGLGDAAALDVGTTAGTVAAGDDSRITGAAQKSGATVTGAWNFTGATVTGLEATTAPVIGRVSVRDYLPADWEDGDDATEGFQDAYAAAVAATKRLSSVGISGWTGGADEPAGTIVIDVPAGIYLVTTPGAMCTPIGPTHGTRGGIAWIGAGRSLTRIVYRPASATDGGGNVNYLVQNDNWRDVRFQGMSFLCDTAGAGWMISTKQPGPTPTTTSPQDMAFDEVCWAGAWSSAIRLVGTNNNSEMQFLRCVVNGSYSQAWLYAGETGVSGGDQFLNYTIIDMKAEYEYGTLLRFVYGGNINIFGGSFIHTNTSVGNPGLFFALGESTIQHAAGVMRFLCMGTRFEHKSVYSKLIKSYWVGGIVQFSGIDMAVHSGITGQADNRTIEFFFGNNSGPITSFVDSYIMGHAAFHADTSGWRWPTNFIFERCQIANYEEVAEGGFIRTTGDNGVGSGGLGSKVPVRIVQCRGATPGGSSSNPRKMLIDQTVNRATAPVARSQSTRVNLRNADGKIGNAAAGAWVPPVVLPAGAVFRALRAVRPVSASETNSSTTWAYTLADAAFTLSSAASIGDGTIAVTQAPSMTAPFQVQVGVGTASELVTVSSVSGSGPYTLTLSGTLTKAHASSAQAGHVLGRLASDGTAWNTAWARESVPIGGRIVSTLGERTLSMTTTSISSTSDVMQMWLEYDA